MSGFLTKPLNDMFVGKPAAKRSPTTKVVAIFEGDSDSEQEIEKDHHGLWTFYYEGMAIRNSRLGDLIEQIERAGGTVKRVSA